MRYSNVVKATTVTDVLATSVLHDWNPDYKVYVGYCDSLYAVTDVTEDEEYAYVESEDADGDESVAIPVYDFLELLEAYSENHEVKCDPARNIDTDLDLQMTNETSLQAVAIDHVCKIVVLIAE